MAVTTTIRIAGPYIGTEVTTDFPFAFKVFLATDLFVLVDDGTGNLTSLTLGIDFTATLNGNQDINPGGSITLTAGPLATGFRMTITTLIAELQQVVLTNLGGFYPNVINSALDRLTILIQQLQVGVDQSLKFPLTDDLTSTQLPPAELRAGKFLYFGADGSVSLVSQAPFTGTGFAFAGNLAGTKDGTNTVFTITNGGSPIGVTPEDILVWDNFPLIMGVGYTLGPNPGQLTFTTAPAAADDIYSKGVFIP